MRNFFIGKVWKGLAQQGAALSPEFSNLGAGSLAFHSRKKNDTEDDIKRINDTTLISWIRNFFSGCRDLVSLERAFSPTGFQRN